MVSARWAACWRARSAMTSLPVARALSSSLVLQSARCSWLGGAVARRRRLHRPDQAASQNQTCPNVIIQKSVAKPTTIVPSAITFPPLPSVGSTSASLRGGGRSSTNALPSALRFAGRTAKIRGRVIRDPQTVHRSLPPRAGLTRPVYASEFRKHAITVIRQQFPHGSRHRASLTLHQLCARSKS
jgi:hypothetical protein